MRDLRAHPRRVPSRILETPSPALAPGPSGRPIRPPRGRCGETLPSRILVVDDDARVARPLIEVLKYQGHEVTHAESGEDALVRLAAERFDLVLLDVKLPGLSGTETCIRIRERHGAALPVLLLTAFPDNDLVRAGYEAGADDFLHKPVDLPHLVLKVKACLRFKALHDEMDGHRAFAQARARDLARLHDIGRDWSLIAEPEEFNRMVTGRLAALTGVPICMLALYDPVTRTLEAALPVHGLPDEVAKKMRYPLRPEYGAAWTIMSGRAYVSNHAKSDPRLIQEAIQVTNAESMVLVPMISEGEPLGIIAAINKPGGFTDGDVQLLTIFAGPAASFLRSRQIFDRQRKHAVRLERVTALVGAMAGETGRTSLARLVVERIHADLGYDRAAVYSSDARGRNMRLEAEAGEPGTDDDKHAELLRWALRSATPLQAPPSADGFEMAVPVHAGNDTLGVLDLRRRGAGTMTEEEVNLLTALAGQLALALQKADGLARTERLAGQLTTLYDLGLETTTLRDLRSLFVKGAEEAGRLIKADHTSVMRLDDSDRTLRIFAAWSRDSSTETFDTPMFRLGEGVAGRVARDQRAAMVNDTKDHPDFVTRRNPVSRLLCVPLTYYEQGGESPAVFGVLNATRRPGADPFTVEDLEYLTRFASQLSIAVSNSMAFAAEKERSEQLALVNTLLREISGTLSRERIMDTAVRRIQEAFQYPVVAISVADYEAGTYRLNAVATRTPWRDDTRSFAIHSGICGRAYRDKQTVHVPDVAKDPDYIALVPSTGSEVAVPIRAGEDVIAVLNVEKAETGGFDHGQVITLQTLADGIGVVLRNADLYQAVEATNAKLVELDRMKSELVNIVAHDFRAPLAGVLGHAELLEWRPDAPREERIEEARSIIHAATHMANLVEKTLKTSRLESGQLPFDFGVFDLASMTKDVVMRQPERRTHPLVVEGVRAGPDPVLGRPRAAGRGPREPDLERGQIFARRRARLHRGEPRPRHRRAEGVRPRGRHRGRGLQPPVPRLLAGAHAAHGQDPGLRPRPLHLRPHRARARRAARGPERPRQGLRVLVHGARVRGRGPVPAAAHPRGRGRRGHAARSPARGRRARLRDPRRGRRRRCRGGRAAPGPGGGGGGPGHAPAGRGRSRGAAQGEPGHRGRAGLRPRRARRARGPLGALRGVRAPAPRPRPPGPRVRFPQAEALRSGSTRGLLGEIE